MKCYKICKKILFSPLFSIRKCICFKCRFQIDWQQSVLLVTKYLYTFIFCSGSLFELMMACNSLDVHGLLELIAKFISIKMLKRLPVDEIRKTLNINGDEESIH